MRQVTRREFVTAASLSGASACWADSQSARPGIPASRERRDLFPEGVASGDPQSDSVLLWTRRPFEYEIVWYPEDRPQGRYDRRLRDIVRYEQGEKIQDFHVPTTVEDYRAVYRAYLHDPDLQDARARWPFGATVAGDRHSFWAGLAAPALPPKVLAAFVVCGYGRPRLRDGACFRGHVGM